jgi:MFS family permease
MALPDDVRDGTIQSFAGTIENVPESRCASRQEQVMSSRDLRHNMVVNIALDAIFTLGLSDLAVAVSPMWVFLGASNTLVGLVALTGLFGLIGVFASPWITARFTYKKWYMFVTHIPYIGTWLITGIVLLCARRLGLPNAQLLAIVVVLTAANGFFGGFVSLPHQEYVAACIPMSHRGRYLGYSWAIGGAMSMVSVVIAGVVLLRIERPMAFGWLYLMGWAFCQGGYICALFARERPTPVEKSPRPWTRTMLSTVWRNKPYIRVLGIWALYNTLFASVYGTYMALYGFRDLKMIAATSAVIGGINQVVRVTMSSVTGHITDKFSPKRVLPLAMVMAIPAMLSLLLIRNQYGVYIATGISALGGLLACTAFTPLLYGLPTPENRAGHFTIQLLLSYITSGIGPVLMGILCDALSYRVTFAITAIGALVLYVVTKRALSDLSTDARVYS